MEWNTATLWQIVFMTIVLDKCQDRRQCNLVASTEDFGEDPCVGTSKYLEVAYKCRPNEFRSRVVCEGEQMALKCQAKSTRLAIYSAMFGRGQRGSIACPADPHFDTECQSPCALEQVMRLCQGRKKCHIPSQENLFGNPCVPGTPKYLSVVYTCVRKHILKEIKQDAYPTHFCGDSTTDQGDAEDGRGRPGDHDTAGAGSRPEVEREFRPDGEEGGGGLNGQPSLVPSTYNYNQVNAPSTPRPQVEDSKAKGTEDPSDSVSANCSTAAPSLDTSKGYVAIGFVTDWIWTWNFIKANQEKFILYILLGTCVGVILMLLVIIVRLLMLRRRRRTHKAKLDISEPIANSTVQPQESTALLDTTDRNDGIEILSYNQSGSLHRPAPPGSFTGSLSRPGHQGGPWNNDYRTDVANRSLNNYYG